MTASLERGFKVITPTLRTSPIMHREYYDAARVTYEAHVVAMPNEGCGPLTVFTDRDQAEGFAEGAGHRRVPLRVVECLFRRSTETDVWYVASPATNGNPGFRWSAGDLPGVVLADAVTCLE